MDYSPPHASPSATVPPDGRTVARLESSLRDRVRGEVRFDRGSRALYATDSSNYRQVPIGVVVPRDAQDVEAAVAVCRDHRVPILARGGGTSLAGQACNIAVVLDFSKHMNSILELDPDRRVARVQPGVVLDDLRDAAEVHHLTFGPDPSTHDRCTMGGMIGNDSCGVHSVMAGKTVHNVLELDVLTYDGLRLRVGATDEAELARIIREGGRRGQLYGALVAVRNRYTDAIRERFPDIPRRVSGYGLDQLLPENGFNVARALVGSENNCVIVLEATVQLVHSPPARSTLVLGYPDISRASRHVTTVLAHGVIGLEGIDDVIAENIRVKDLAEKTPTLLPPGRGWLFAEIGADTREEADAKARALKEALEREPDAPSVRFFEDPAEAKMVWAIREAGLAAAARGAGGELGWPGWEDVGIAPERIGDYLRDFVELEERYGYRGALYGHFGDGCIHTRINFDLATTEGIAKYRAFVEEAAHLVVRYGGSLSGEHGDGQARGELLPIMYGEELMQAFRDFKAIWDPQNMMNPGKLLDARPLDADLRLGAGFEPVHPPTQFRFPEDGGSFGDALLRCVGVGKCRRNKHGVMCPSYMATLEETHSTRGRARLLWEALQGDVLEGGWRNEEVREALDLCLACKGCKGECPVNVDMATYKAEFLSHYYSGRPRPLSAYTMGLIFWWARLASLAPGLANWAAQGPRLGATLKRVIGVAEERRLPVFARRTFKSWFRHEHRPWDPQAPAVVLWPDTFSNHFHPHTAKSAVAVLEAAGFRVIVPRERLCCGRPLYDFGMLSLAKRLLRKVLDSLEPWLDDGVPVVGLEPSCLSVFRDELISLFPDDPRARRLAAQSFTLAEFLQGGAASLGSAYSLPGGDGSAGEDYPGEGPPIEAGLLTGSSPPRLERRALVHVHCHQRALIGTSADERLLASLGVDASFLDSGCCGMAGPFGFEESHYRLSVDAAERVLMPAVRTSASETLIVADGFSCREQIAQLDGREALHLAEVLALALGGDSGLPEPEPM
ncbi:MAG: FAD-binding and (Fe-S)-binding domain-containing protein [Thermoleophilia bacterium]